MIRCVAELERLGAAVVAVAGEPRVAVVALAARACLIEANQLTEVRRAIAFESDGFGEPTRHLVAQVSLAVDHELQIIRRAQTSALGERAKRQPAPIFSVEVVVAQKRAVIEI